jgi:hypothetical protein
VNERFLGCAFGRKKKLLSPSNPYLCNNMSHLNAEAKHHILLEYLPRDAHHSFSALARRHAVAGGERTIRRWHQRWNGTPHSLERKDGSGKARILTAAEVTRHIRAPILAANRSHRAIHYTELLPEVKRKTGKEISLRSLQQYGKEELAIKQKHTKKRTASESEWIHTSERVSACMLSEQ